MGHYSRLTQGNAAFDKMIQKFGVVTVMNVHVFDTEKLLDKTNGLLKDGFEKYYADQIADILEAEAEKPTGRDASYLCKLDTLKTSNITEEGPTKTVTGGQNASPLLKYGKTARLEMQDALGNAEALEALAGMTVEYKSSNYSGRFAVHAGDQFSGPKTLLGESFFIDQESGAQVKVQILIYKFLPDSLFNLTQDAEGDATVFDMNGDLIATQVKVGTDGVAAHDLTPNIFYSIVDASRDHASSEE